MYNLSHAYAYASWDALSWSWCISWYSHHLHTRLHCHTRHQTVLRLTIQVHMQHFPLLLRSVASPYLRESLQTNIVQTKSMWIIFRCLIKTLLQLAAVGRERVQSVAWYETATPLHKKSIQTSWSVFSALSTLNPWLLWTSCASVFFANLRNSISSFHWQ